MSYKGRGRVTAGVLLLLASALCWPQASDLPAKVNTGTAVAVSCNADLNFGNIVISGNSTGGEVQILPEASATSTIISGSGFYLSGASWPAECSVTAVSGTTVSLSLSGGGGVYDPATGVLSNASLLTAGGEVMPINLTLSHTTGEPATAGNAEPIIIGGTVTAPSGGTAVFGTFDEVFTITVVEN